MTSSLSRPRVFIGGKKRRSAVRSWSIAAGVFVLLAATSVLSGLSSVAGAEYWSSAQVFEDFMNGPVRLLFPVAAALLAGSELASLLAHRGIANTRTRDDVRRQLVRVFASGVGRTFLVFAGVALVCAVAAFVFVPAVWPHAVDPQAYELRSAQAVRAADAAIAPLSVASNAGWGALAGVAALWEGANAAAFGLLALICVVLIPRAVVALLVPAVVYIAESAVLQYQGLPGASFVISAVYPAGLQRYPLSEAVAPTAVLIVACAVVAVVLIARAPTSRRMS